MIFHITERDTWRHSLEFGEHTESTRGITLEQEGFIHCSTHPQVAEVLEQFYSGVSDLVLLHIDEALLASPLVYEQLRGAPGPFPHVYGPINIDAVVSVQAIDQQ